MGGLLVDKDAQSNMVQSEEDGLVNKKPNGFNVPVEPQERESTAASVFATTNTAAFGATESSLRSADRTQPPPNMTNGSGHDEANSIVPFPDLDADPTLGPGAGEIWDDSVAASQLEGTHSISASDEHQIQAFAKLEFDDGEFYMNTYAVELGRDIRAARLASEQDPQPHDGSSRKRSGSSVSAKSSRSRRDLGRRAAGSVVSESGGFIGVDPPAPDSGRKGSRSKAKSISSSSQQLSRKSSVHMPKTDYNALALESLRDYGLEAESLNGTNLAPSPEMTPLIPIHPPAAVEGLSRGHKSISRKHLRIAFNFERNFFELKILGRNGAFVDEEWYVSGHTLPLVSGSIIQIGGVGIRFVLPDVPPGETGAEREDEGDPLSGGQVGFDMADSDEGEANEQDDISMMNERGRRGAPHRGGKEKPLADLEPPKPKRKGPGRPPKNGIISKREQALLARQAREEAKAAAEGKTKSALGHGKGKTAKALEMEAQNLQPNGKRKYTKRKRAGIELEQQIRDSTEQTDSMPPDGGNNKQLKEKSKPIKPPRSPSPVFDESKLTPEQLAKPQSSYVVLIHEALSNSKTGQMSLPQIYRAIERRYPFFKLRVQTQGWQSSVRHNLSQHPAFKKIERDGKGWMWGLVPEVSIEKEKKRRPTPPPQLQPHYYQHPQNYPQRPYPYQTMAPPNTNGLPTYPYSMPTRLPYTSGLGPAGFTLPFLKPPSESTYKSPYESAAPATPASEPKAESRENGISGTHSTPISQPTPQSQITTAGPSGAPSTSPAPAGEAGRTDQADDKGHNAATDETPPKSSPEAVRSRSKGPPKGGENTDSKPADAPVDNVEEAGDAVNSTKKSPPATIDADPPPVPATGSTERGQDTKPTGVYEGLRSTRRKRHLGSIGTEDGGGETVGKRDAKKLAS